MSGRSLIHEHGADEQIRALGIGFERYDDLMLSIELALLRYPEMFPTIPKTRLSICKTNEFVGGQFSEIPSLAMDSKDCKNDHKFELFRNALSKIAKADTASSRAAIQASKATKPSLHTRFVYDPAKGRV
jgi:hypothetical protein